MFGKEIRDLVVGVGRSLRSSFQVITMLPASYVPA